MTRNPAAQHSRSRWLARLGAFAAAVTLTSAGAVAAQPAADRPSMAVHYTATDLATDKGLRALYSRIARAAEQVCPAYIQGGLAFQAEHRVVAACRQQAIALAMRQIGSPRLAALARHVQPVG